MQLCGHSVSPYFERVVIALDMKGALDQVELAGVPGGFKSDEHFSLHPMGKIPFLIKDDGTSITEGQVIAEYLDRVLDGPDLTPHDFEQATQGRLIARILDLYYAEAVRPYGRLAFGGEATDAEVEKAKTQDIPAAFTYLEKYMGEGLFAVGDSWTLADAALISHLYWYGALKVRFGLEGYGRWPKLDTYWNHVKDTDIVTRSFDRVKHSYDEFFGGDDN
ncbi:glutathione S-transferase family protein [Kordiimonas lipolytica]|uniref:Glutathione S-transferase family protein n=1 Tax=Kordiimonas lipolytica TaxID=1662421 RepID=A0ABV8U8F6_9PROT|nr:glutathione S-transferase family protein [Kordiimonas lipolytica]